jgi:phosphoglycerate dehydrogenase-like enzyme
MIRVLCTALNAESGPHFQILADAGHECHVVDRSLDLWNPAVLSRAIQDYDAVIAGSEPWPPDVIASSGRLRVIARAGVGFDAVNLAACDDRRIVVATTPGCNHHSVAEQAIAMLMAVGRGFPSARSGGPSRRMEPQSVAASLGTYNRPCGARTHRPGHRHPRHRTRPESARL